MRIFIIAALFAISYAQTADIQLLSQLGVPNCGDGYVLVAVEHDHVEPECDQFGCPEVDSCDSCKEACDDDSSCEAFECNASESGYSCSFNGHLIHTEECGPLCQSQTVCVKNSTEIDGSHFIAPASQNRRKLWLLSAGPITPPCNPGYEDKTNGNAYWWACGWNCPGGMWLTDSTCTCACGEVGACTGGEVAIYDDALFSINQYKFSSNIPDLSVTPFAAFGGGGVSSLFVDAKCALVCYTEKDYKGLSLTLSAGYHNMVHPSTSRLGWTPYHYHDSWNNQIRSCKFVEHADGRRALATSEWTLEQPEGSDGRRKI